MIKHRVLVLTIFLLSCLVQNISAKANEQLTTDQKLYGLSLFWKEVSYNFAYFDQVKDLDWDATYTSYIPRVMQSKNDFEYYRILSQLAAKLQDGMTYINMPKDLVSQYMAFPGVKLAEAENKAIVVAVENNLKNVIPMGSVILEVDGRSVFDVLKSDVLPYISSSTEQIRLDQAIKGDFSQGYGLLAGPPGSEITLKLQLPDKTLKTIKLTRNLTNNNIHWYSSEHMALIEKENSKSIVGRSLGNGLYYVALNNFSDLEMVSKFREMIPDMQSSKGLILDLRFNQGGNTMIAEDILKYLTFHDLVGAKSRMRIHNATFKAWGKYAKDYEWAKKYEQYYIGQVWTEMPADVLYANEVSIAEKIVLPTAILISRDTSSAAENFLIYTDGAEQFTTIGETTFGSTGQPLVIDLPGGGKAKICTKRDSYADGRDFVGYGIKPDIYVARNISYYLSNEDHALNVAEKFLKQSNTPSKSGEVAKLQ